MSSGQSIIDSVLRLELDQRTLMDVILVLFTEQIQFISTHSTICITVSDILANFDEQKKSSSILGWPLLQIVKIAQLLVTRMKQVGQTNRRNLHNFTVSFRKTKCTRLIMQEMKCSKAVCTRTIE
jgi:hypothetical protein